MIKTAQHYVRSIWRAVYSVRWMFLELKAPHKPSITRVSWWVVVVCGAFMWMNEIFFWAGHETSPAAWQAWAVAFTVCGSAVGFPKVVDFWKSGGTQAIGAISQAKRLVTDRRKKAEDAGDPGSEYTE